MSDNKEVVKLDKFHWHEAIDRTHCIQEMLNELVTTHPVVVQNKAIRDIASRVHSELGELYQVIGQLTPEK